MRKDHVVTKRNPLLVVALTFLSFTLYAYYWLFKTTDELKEESGRDDLHPFLDVVLAALTFGLWGLWAGYRNAKITHELFDELGEEHTDRSVPVALFGAASIVSGWTWLISMFLLQDDYNRLAQVLDDDARRAAQRARVELDSEDEAEELTEAEPGFQSKAPRPIVF